MQFFLRAALFLFAPFLGCAGTPVSGELTHADPHAKAFVAEYVVMRRTADARTLRSLVRAISSGRYFTRVERRVMARWHRDPPTRTRWLAQLARTRKRLLELTRLAKTRLLDGPEAKDLSQSQRSLTHMQRRNAAWKAIYSKVNPRDYPFVLRASDALRLQVIDGCTSASRIFCLLAQTAGLDARPVEASNLETLREIWKPNEKRMQKTVNGHKMALVKLGTNWRLVNTNSYAPLKAMPYEILTELDGKPLMPQSLAGKVIRLPSAQVADGRRSPVLVVTAVGKKGTTSLGEYSQDANLNLAVSGNPDDATCKNPALKGLMKSR